MPNPTAKQSVTDAETDELDDETMPLPALSHLLEASEPGADGGASGTELVSRQLARLIELAEAANGRLDRIGELLAKPGSAGRSSAKKRVSKKKAAPGSST